MNNRSIHVLLVATTVFSSSIFVSSSPVKAHSFDYCLTIQQVVAAEIQTGRITKVRQLRRELRKRYGRAFRVYEKDCDAELKAAGFITLQQLRQGLKNKSSEALADGILNNGADTQLSIDPVAVEQNEADTNAFDAEAKQDLQQAKRACAAQDDGEASGSTCPSFDEDGNGINENDEAP